MPAGSTRILAHISPLRSLRQHDCHRRITGVPRSLRVAAFGDGLRRIRRCDRSWTSKASPDGFPGGPRDTSSSKKPSIESASTITTDRSRLPTTNHDGYEPSDDAHLVDLGPLGLDRGAHLLIERSLAGLGTWASGCGSSEPIPHSRSTLPPGPVSWATAPSATPPWS